MWNNLFLFGVTYIWPMCLTVYIYMFVVLILVHGMDISW